MEAERDKVGSAAGAGGRLEIAAGAAGREGGRTLRRVRLVNALVPGLGLIWRDRLIGGLALGLLFWLPVTGAFYLTWISPGRVPFWGQPALAAVGDTGERLLARTPFGRFAGTDYAASTVVALTLTLVAIMAYLACQMALAGVLRAEDRRLAEDGPRIASLLRSAYAAMGTGQWVQTRIGLDEALALDSENLEANLALARLLAIQGKDDQAAMAYARCRQLPGAARWNWEIARETGIITLYNKADVK